MGPAGPPARIVHSGAGAATSGKQAGRPGSEIGQRGRLAGTPSGSEPGGGRRTPQGRNLQRDKRRM